MDELILSWNSLNAVDQAQWFALGWFALIYLLATPTYGVIKKIVKDELAKSK